MPRSECKSPESEIGWKTCQACKPPLCGAKQALVPVSAYCGMSEGITGHIAQPTALKNLVTMPKRPITALTL